ncbi:MAG: RHS repeat-associated core domain-containing protein [Candidatus Hydrogenedentes bacterium]|nr:RHS repeat-associated core domain-containing protein [Candidatus Hydrogenedentota bacterium]
MTTNYTYDTKNRLSAIEHKDGGTVLDGFTYELDDSGNITKTTHEDGSYWDYAYDDRYRLIDADRFSASGNIKAAYAYTYDDGDNMLTITEPFFDDFNDGNTTGWTTSGTWSATNNMLESTGTGGPIASLANTDNSNEIMLRYRINDTSDSLTRAYIDFRHVDWNNYEWVRIFRSSINIGKNVSGVGTQIASGNATSTANVWYNLRIVADGANVDVYRWADGAMPTLICSTTSSPSLSTTTFKLNVVSPYLYDFDDIRILADSLSNTTTFTVNNSNELVTMVDYNGTTNFTFDDWGRMTEKERVGSSATYSWNYGYNLTSVSSNFAGEGTVGYEFGGDRKRRERVSSGNTTWYNYGGWLVLNEEDGSGNLSKTYDHDTMWPVGAVLADLAGATPSSGTPRFYERDNIGSTRRLRDSSKASLGQYDYDPYGVAYIATGATITNTFTGHIWDSTANLYWAPYRFYSPAEARWLSRDLLISDGPNFYVYAQDSPIVNSDPFGLWTWTTEPGPPPNMNTIVCDGVGSIVPVLNDAKGNLSCGIGDCLREHEKSHAEDALKAVPDICKDKEYGTLVVNYNPEERAASERKACDRETECLDDELKKYKPGSVCEILIKDRIQRVGTYRDQFED